MIRYSPELIQELFLFIVEHKIYDGSIVEMFLTRKTFNGCRINISDIEAQVVFNRMLNYSHTWISQKFPTKLQKKNMQDIRKVIFELSLNDMPKHINDPLTGPIASWRLNKGI